MSRLIDADELEATMIETLEQIKANPKMNGQEMHIIAGIAMLGEMIDDSPTIDAVPVVRGKWIIHNPFDSGRHNCNECIECSVCGTWFGHDCYEISNFCPNCGADMRQTGDENV